MTTLLLSGAISWASYLFNWWTWWVGDTLGILMCTPLLVVWGTQAWARQPRRAMVITLPTGLMCAAAILLFAAASTWERDRLRLEFERRAEHIVSAFEGDLRRYLEVLESLRRFYASSPEVERQAFRTFVAPVFSRYPGIQALSWEPLVPAVERIAYEDAVRREGSSHFTFTEWSPQGKLVPAQARPEYVPVYYLEPSEGNEKAFGFDLASEPTRLEALHRARDTGQPAMTSRIRLVQDAGDGVLILLPIYRNGLPHELVEERRKNLHGYISGVFQIDEMVEASLRNIDSAHLELRLFDKTAQDGEQLLYIRRAKARQTASSGEEPSWEHPTWRFQYTATHDMAGRQWEFRFALTLEYLAIHQSWSAWMVLVGGLLFAGLLQGFLLVVTGETIRSERLVLHRTAELAKANEALQEARDHLERRVAERTAEIVTLNRQLAAQQQAIDQFAIVAETDPQGRIIYANDQFCQISKYRREELIGKDHRDVVNSGYHPPAFWKGMWATIGQEKIWRGDVKNRAKDGEIYWVDTAIVPFMGADGNPEKYLAVRAVITERKRAETALQQLNEELEHRVTERTEQLAKANVGLQEEIAERKRAEEEVLTKNRELETLLHVISHDLHEPLRTIQNFSQLIYEQHSAQLTEEPCDFIRRVVGAAQRIGRLLDDLLALSRARQIQVRGERVPGRAIVEKALGRLRDRIRSRGTSVRVMDDLPTLRADKTWAVEAVYNLVENAMKFTRNGEPPHIEIAGYRARSDAQEMVGIIVRDRGPGVAPEHAERIFELFQRAVGREVEGTGAGLAIVRTVAERHGGRAWVQPRERIGSEFVITFGAGGGA